MKSDNFLLDSLELRCDEIYQRRSLNKADENDPKKNKADTTM